MKKIFKGTLVEAEEKAIVAIEGNKTVRESAQYIAILLDKISHKDFVQLMSAKSVEIRIKDAVCGNRTRVLSLGS